MHRQNMSVEHQETVDVSPEEPPPELCLGIIFDAQFPGSVSVNLIVKSKIALKFYIYNRYNLYNYMHVHVYIEVILWVDLYMIFIHERGCDICHE